MHAYIWRTCTFVAKTKWSEWNQEHSKVGSAETQSILETIYLVNSAESDFWALWKRSSYVVGIENVKRALNFNAHKNNFICSHIKKISL